MYTSAVLLGMLPMAFAHMGLWDPSAFGFNGDGYTLVEPLSGKPFNQWWFHGNLNQKPTGPPMSLPAGGTVTVEIACNKDFTSFGKKAPSYHAGTPIDPNQLLGCGLAIAYKDDATKVQPEDFTIFSVNDKCVNGLKQAFPVPAKMPPCPKGKCICAWFWQGQDSDNEMYMTGFECKVDGATGTTSVGKPLPPKYCPNGSDCVSGPKQPMYWANERPNVQFSGDFLQKPSYNAKWGFKNGAQDDIFDGTSGSKPGPADPTPTTLLTVTSKPAPTATASPGGGTCSWPGHCAGASCGSNNDCSDALTCKNGKCA
ncbi:hypothetical protein L873DRAFT_1032902 [Choiromyces venosus 120613-1]|uniref:Chitin-binding type-4 domain-containing protein n=1 Tax=Choiromyces venosus 120613-1 TaxID=1336337 RepID=A0A3N4JJU2_9PEZI|nr:hypothetical protein L873DRAFT_1032902 [Choiromyces venosus 120613-1]